MLDSIHLELTCSLFTLRPPERTWKQSTDWQANVVQRAWLRPLAGGTSRGPLFSAAAHGAHMGEGLALRPGVNSLSSESGRCFLGYSIACVWGNWDTGNFPFFLSSVYLHDYYSKTECCDLSPGALHSGRSVLTWVCVWVVWVGRLAGLYPRCALHSCYGPSQTALHLMMYSPPKSPTLKHLHPEGQVSVSGVWGI